jgi:hypothetical protein
MTSEASRLPVFVDNRLDAALRAGHYNDFARVALLRGTPYRGVVVEVGWQGGPGWPQLCDGIILP